MKIEKYIFISDIHSNIELLEKLPERIPEWNDETTKIIFGGDYIDGFNQSPGAGLKVLKFIKELCDNGKALAIIGNHDNFIRDMFLSINTDFKIEAYKTWMINGGKETLDNWSEFSEEKLKLYSLSGVKAFLSQHKELIDWLINLPVIIQPEKNIFVVHAGFDLSKPIEEQYRDYCLWVRKPFYTFDGEADSVFKNKIIVSGHTPNEFLTGKPDVIKLVDDRNNIIKYLIDAGSKSSKNSKEAKLNILILDKDGNYIRDELIYLE